jgi:hypothetical protein
MQHGFKKIVVDLVRADPGHTPDYYARKAIDGGLAGSDSADPVFSLQTTLRKEVREGRMPDIIARKVDGKLHCFPSDQNGNVPATGGSPTVLGVRPSDAQVTLTVQVPHELIGELDLLVDLGKARSRPEALVRLARTGIKAKRQELDRAREFNQRTKEQRESFSL